MAGSLARGVVDPHPTRHREELATRALQLRTETVEVGSIPDTSPAFDASWTYLAAAEDLIRMLTGPQALGAQEDGRGVLGPSLEAIEARCAVEAARRRYPDEASGSLTSARPPAPARPSAAVGTPAAATRGEVDLARMATAVAVLVEAT
jgi:hypothetical protein